MNYTQRKFCLFGGFHYKYCLIPLLLSLLLFLLWLSGSFAFAQQNGTSFRHFIIDFESIIVNSRHDPLVENEHVTSWAFDAYVNGKRVKLNPAGELSFINIGKEIPLGIRHDLVIPENDTIKILISGFDEDGNDLNQTEIRLDTYRNIIEHADIGGFRINIPNLINTISKPMDREDDPIGTIIQEFDKDENNFGLGTHTDCSEMTIPIINLEDGKTTACDFILRYTIREENRTLGLNDWKKENWKSVPGNKSIVSNPSVISNGPGKFDLFAVGTDGVLWHINYDYGFGAWEPLSTYSNIPNAFLPSNSTVGLSSWSPSRLDVFVKDQNNRTQYKWLEISDRGWQQEWIELAGEIGSEPSVFSLAPTRISLFAMDNNTQNVICTMNITAGENGPSYIGWVTKQPYSNTKQPVAACSNGTNGQAVTNFLGVCDLECHVMGSLQEYISSQNHIIKSPPVLVATVQGRIDSFTLIDDGKMLYQYYEPDETNEWRLVNSSTSIIFENYTFTSRPSVVSKSNADIDLELYAQTADGHLRNATYNGEGWTDLEDLGDIDSPPSVVSWQDPETTYVFAKSGTSLVYNWKGYN